MTGSFAGDADDILLARAFLNRVAEPASVPLWGFVREVGPVAAAADIQCGTAPEDVMRVTAARAATVDPEADLLVAERRGIRLVVPESPEWPHFALACLEQTGLARLAEFRNGKRAVSESGELVPPLALWVRGTADLATAAVRSAALVGARASTTYGDQVAADLAFGLAGKGLDVVSGGAFGIDAAAHRGALAAGGRSILISAGGLDSPYPPSHARLFDQCAETGLLVSESPPGAAPRRRRFLTRNRLIAALSTGTVVVEASARSGAANTARHCIALDRPLMVVPGPITSPMSAGCHDLLRRYEGRAQLVTSLTEVLAVVGSFSDLPLDAAPEAERADRLTAMLDALDPLARDVFDSLPARRVIGVEDITTLSGRPVVDVIRSLSVLELAGLVQRSDDGIRVKRDPCGTCVPGADPRGGRN